MNSRQAAFLELCKPRITFMVVLMSAFGYFLAVKRIDNWFIFLATLLGTALSSAGAASLNHYVERDVDCLMNRTKSRPIPSGLIAAPEALFFGVFLVLLGTVFLSVAVNLLTAFLALMTAFLYVVVYTPLKRVTWLNTFIGAIPGALPPMGGWAAATGEVGVGAWILFAILFAWQHPHFFAIAWMHKEDYARGGFKMLPVIEPDGKSTFRQMVIYSCILIGVSVLPTCCGIAGFAYLIGSVTLGFAMLASSLVFGQTYARVDARRVLLSSLIYLPALFILIIGDSVL